MQPSLKFITPQTPADATPYLQPIETLIQQVPESDDALSFTHSAIPHLTLVYFEHLLVGGFVLGLNKTSAELHGVINQRFNERVTPAVRRAVKRQVYKTVLDAAFQDGRTMVLAMVWPEHPIYLGGVKAWLRQQGFKRFVNKNGQPLTNKGRDVYKLTKDDYELRKEKQSQHT